MPATAREKEPGRWYVFINRAGIRKAKAMPSKAEALKVAKEYNRREAAGDLDMLKEPAKPFKHYCREWEQQKIQKDRKKSTQGDYSSIIENHLCKAPFWKTPINQISKNDIERFIDRAKNQRNKNPLSASSKNHIKVVCSHAFQYAADDGVKVTNHAKNIAITNSDDPDQEILDDEENEIAVAYTEDEIDLLLNQVKGRFYYPVLLTLCHTGMRTGEVSGIRWSDVNLKNRVITIRRAFVRGNITSPKSKKRRHVDMSRDLVAELKAHKKRQFEDKDQKNHSYVFQNRAGGMLDWSNFRRRVYNPAVKKAGLEASRIHDLRHSFTTNLALATSDPVYVFEQLGHASIDFTMKRYFKNRENNSEVRKIDLLFATNEQRSATQKKKGANQSG